MNVIDQATQLGVDLLSSIHEGEPAPLDVAVVAFIRTETTVTLVFEWGDTYVLWDADADTELFDTPETALRTLARGLANEFG